MAAFNVGGETIHSLLNLPIGSVQKMQGLPVERLQKLQPLLKPIQYLFCDEMSMLSQEELDCVDSRLREIKGKNEPFGGISMILAGDFAQLPPSVPFPCSPRTRRSTTRTQFTTKVSSLC